MIGYMSFGTNDFKRAAVFYDQLLGEFGAKRVMDYDTFIAWNAEPYNKQPATVGNGTMIAFEVENPARVDAMYRKALELGAADDGPPGPRGDDYYGAYLRDLDGNKLNFHCYT